MKLYRNAIILIIVLAIIVGVYFALDKFLPKEEEVVENNGNPFTLIDVKYDDVSEVIIENSGTTMVFTRTNADEWGLSSPANVRADKYKSKAVVLNLTPLKANKIIEENVKDLEKYGLDKPVVVTVKTSDGEEKVVEFGKKTLTGENYYARMKGEDTVYTVSDYYGGKLVIDLNYITDRNLFTIKAEDITNFTLFRDGQIAFSVYKGEDSSWLLSSPVEGSVDASKLQPVLEKVVGISANEYIDKSPEKLVEYGLDNPRYVIEIQTASATDKIFVGKDKDKGNTAYGMLESNGNVFILPLNSLNFVDKPLKDVIDVFAYIININDVNKVTVSMDGNYDVFDIEHTYDDEGKVKSSKFFANGIEVTAEDERGNNYFRNYYRALIGLPMSEVELGANPVGQPEISITYYITKNSSSMKVDFISKDDYYYYVMKNGKYSGILVAKKEFDKTDGVREEYRTLMDSLAK